MTAARRATIASLSVVALLLAAVLGYLIGRSPEAPTTTAPGVSQHAPTPTIASPTPTPSAVATKLTTPSPGPADPDDGSSDGPPYSQTDEAKQHWEPVVEGFGKAFTDTEGSDKAWLLRLESYATEDVRQSLATVDPGNVPEGLYGEYEILEHGETELAAQVTYREGWSIVLYLINEGKKWRVFRYDRFEE